MDSQEAKFIKELDAWARSAGYIALVRCTSVQTSEFNAIYRHPKLAHTLFGFRTESGHIHMHINFSKTARILPHIAQMPRAFRELYYERCTCANCNRCQDGPLKIELEGALRRLCRFSYMNLPDVPVEHFGTIDHLLKVQDGLLKE